MRRKAAETRARTRAAKAATGGGPLNGREVFHGATVGEGDGN
jgi:hypothetical protein